MVGMGRGCVVNFVICVWHTTGWVENGMDFVFMKKKNSDQRNMRRNQERKHGPL
jgi:hypothetical protein